MVDVTRLRLSVRNACAKCGAISSSCATCVLCAEYLNVLGGFVLDNLQPHSPTGGINAFGVRLSLSQGEKEKLGDKDGRIQASIHAGCRHRLGNGEHVAIR